MTSRGDWEHAPAIDELEVSLFGPGRGEAIAIHMGGGDWITVDSCIDQTSGGHPVLEYLASLGVDVSHQVRMVIGTHAHDDHVAGLARIHEAAHDAQFVTSAALTSNEFYADIEADQDIEDQLNRSVRSEYRAIYDEVERRKTLSDGRVPMRHAIEERVLWSRDATETVPFARLTALSPSDRAITRARKTIAQGSAKASDRRRLAATDPNELAIALWIEVGSVKALLGADLTVGPMHCGWKAVLAWFKPDEKAMLFKVAHHGSPNADHPAVWADLLDENVLSMVAPFRMGVNPRPNATDVARIVELSGSAFATARTRVPAAPKSVRRAKASLSALASNVREPYGRAGQVRARRSQIALEWSVDLSDPAHQLS